MATIELSHGFVLATADMPPSGFDPTRASAADLKKYGYPPKPQPHSSMFKQSRWAKGLRRVSPRIIETSWRHRVAAPTKMAMRPALAEATNDHWSGVVVFPSRGNPFTQCVGSWGVPQATRFENDHVTTYHISCWTGIDGDGTSDVVQAGTHGLVEPDGTTGFYAWFEWYPLNEQQIDPVSFPVEPGDQVEVALAVDAPNTLTYYFTNFTKNNYTQGQIVAPRGVTCAGNCAEWIVERPAINGELSQLAYYNQVYFDTAVATGNDQTIPPADLRDGTEFSMLVDGKIISVGAEISINGVSRPSDSLTCTDKRGVNDGAE